MRKIISVLLLISTLALLFSACKEDKIKKGETSTSEEWSKMVKGDFSNFSGIMESESGVLYFSRDGEQWYEKLVVGENVMREEGEFLVDGELVHLKYDSASAKWKKNNNPVEEKDYPVANMPIERSKFAYDTKKGEYYYELPSAKESFEKNNIKEDACIRIRFNDGLCTYLRVPYGISKETGKAVIVTYEIYDYTTTRVSCPDKELIDLAG